MLRKGLERARHGSRWLSEVTEEILAGDASVSEKRSDYGCVVNIQPTRLAFGSGD